MSQQTRKATEAERKDFIQKLGRFRASLPDHEKAMLDAIMITAEGARGAGDVQGYAWFWGNDPVTPRWYTGVQPPGATSPWWENYNTPWS
ncbi:MAG TPA: hypothetical protein VK066_26030 [Chloroflexota bacterium]|nr:hypothetical protein [Chloroflexota bacterium]